MAKRKKNEPAPDIPLSELTEITNMSQWFKARIQLAFHARTPTDVAHLEQLLDTTQTAIVDEFIERSCWSEDPMIRPYTGGNGTFDARRNALLNQERPAGTG
jgi:hypothetical protein